MDGGGGRLFSSSNFTSVVELNPMDGSIINSFPAINSISGLAFTGKSIYTSVPSNYIDEYDPNTGNHRRTFFNFGFAALAGIGTYDATWLTSSPSALTIPAGDSALININLYCNQLQQGCYTAIVKLQSNDPDSSSISIPVILDIIIGIENESQLPKSFALYQNYPNPFNPATTIKYDIPVNSHVSLKIYDILGNEVRSFINEEKTAGSYELNWNATEFASGVYIYRLQAINPESGSGQVFVDTKKLILMK
jgi:hypothetical protein